MVFARLSSSMCCSSELECRCCHMTVLPVLACRLNRCCAYLANAAMPTWKWGPSGLDTASRRCFHTGSSWLRDWHHDSVGESGLTQGGECDLCRLLDGLIQLDPDDSCHPRLHRVEGYHHIDLALVLAMGHRHAAAIDRSVSVVAELAECVLQHSRKTRAMLARGAKVPIRSDGDVGVVVHVHLKTQP
jgi:hypothetical protein